MIKKKQLIYICIFIILISVCSYVIWGNSALEVNNFTVYSSKLTESFNGFRIAHVSDLHNTYNKKLIPMLEAEQPDIIAITGDLLDSRRTDTELVLEFIDDAMGIAPCYYVTGNHESRLSEYADFKDELISRGVVVLDDKSVEIEKDGELITVVGVDDPCFIEDYNSKYTADIITQKLSNIEYGKNFTVLLSHRPDIFKAYVENDLDLVLSGHAHGGQFRLPYFGGLFTLDQGFFPEYDSGLYTEDNTNMIVSRGIGNSVFPFRLNNRPEIIIVELVVE